MTEVGSSIYATPLIHDLYSDGQKDIIVPSFVHYLEASLLTRSFMGRGISLACWRCSLWPISMQESDSLALLMEG